VDKKAILRINIFKGNNPPYFLKSKRKENGTYIRVGSSNRLASEEIIAELERKSANKSFDSKIIFEKTLHEIDIESFKLFFEERTGEELSFKILSKLHLYEEINGDKYPTSALILLSDDSLRYKLFPYAKIECARFKGTTPGNFIDRKTIDINTAQQAEIAFQFIMLDVSITNKLRENWIEGVSSVNKMYRILGRCEIGKLGLKGDKSRILKLTSMTNVQKNILDMFNCKYLGMKNHLKSIGVKKM